MIRTIKVNNTLYSCCKDISNFIGFSKSKYDTEIKKLKRDTDLKNRIIKSYIDSNGGKQMSIFIETSFIKVWLYKINSSLLNKKQIININQILSYIDNYIEIKTNNVDNYCYKYECQLRDEIYNYGFFNNIKIIEKEKVYSFGRIDLYGVDKDNNKICIELKKEFEFYDTKQQLLKYKESKCFDKIIYCALNIDKDFLLWLKNNDIIAYTYKRELKLSEVYL